MNDSSRVPSRWSAQNGCSQLPHAEEDTEEKIGAPVDVSGMHG